jgi:hypothetical protein
MTHSVHLVDGAGTHNKVCVTAAGQLTVAPFSYDDAVHMELAEPNIGYNFYWPVQDKRFVITGITMKADRDVSNTVDAVVIVYEADSEDETTVTKEIFQESMIRGERTTLLPLNIIVTEGQWLNAKTTDDDIHMTIMGYYVPA